MKYIFYKLLRNDYKIKRWTCILAFLKPQIQWEQETWNRKNYIILNEFFTLNWYKFKLIYFKWTWETYIFNLISHLISYYFNYLLIKNINMHLKGQTGYVR